MALTGLFIIVVYRLDGRCWPRSRWRAYALISYAAAGLARRDPDAARPGRLRARHRAWRSTRTCWSSSAPGRSTPRRRGEGLAAALDTGYRKAWSAILDSNVTTLLAAGLLFFLACGPVKGFGVTLSIGVVASMVSALVVARVLTDWAVRAASVHAAYGCPGSPAAGRLRDLADRARPDLMRRAGTGSASPRPSLVLAVAGSWCAGSTSGWSSPAAGCWSTRPASRSASTRPGRPSRTPGSRARSCRRPRRGRQETSPSAPGRSATTRQSTSRRRSPPSAAR